MPDIATETAPMPTDMDSAMAAILTETKAQTLADESTTPTRNDKGQFVAASGATTATPPAQQADDVVPADATGDVADPTAPVAPEIPEGYVAVKALPADRVQGFTVFDAEGEVQAPELTFKFNANGKEREATTDKLIRMAQMGIYNADREEQAQQANARVQQAQQQLAAQQQAVQLRDQQIEALLSDPDFLQRAQEAYYQHNTPEARAERDRQALAQQQAQFQQQQVAAQSRQFVDGTMAPALEMLLTAYPTITQDELAAKFFLAADPYRQNGVLQPQGYDALKRWVVMELEPQTRQLHEHRQSERDQSTKTQQATTDKAKADVAAALVQAQKAKRTATTALKPAGKAMTESKPAPVVRTMKDAETTVIEQTLAAIRGG
jgi:hypothetical protein